MTTREEETNIVLETLQERRDKLWGMTQKNMERGAFNIMDSIRLEAIEKLDAAIAAHEREKAEQRQEVIGEVHWAADIPNSIVEVKWRDGVTPAVGTKLYTAPQPLPWVGMTNEAVTAGVIENRCGVAQGEFPDVAFMKGARWAESLLREKNAGGVK